MDMQANSPSQVEPDNIDVGLLAIVGAFIGVVVLLIVVLLQAWFYNWKAEITAARTLPGDAPQTPYGRALIEQQEQLNSYHWANRESKTRAIPIERAMELVVKEMSGEKEKAEGGRRKAE
jgi:hypothetical protein